MLTVAREGADFRSRLAARNKTLRLSHSGAAGRRRCPADYRAGNDFSSRFPFIAMAVIKLPVRPCLIDGEAIVCDETGLAVLMRRHGALSTAVHCAFDLLELDGRDLRREPIEKR